MINDIFNFLIDNRDKLVLISSDAHLEDKNTYIYETIDSEIILVTDKHIKPLSIDIRRKDG